MLFENAFAKINLYLEVTGKRQSGYHELVTVMQTVSLCDRLTFTSLEEPAVQFCCTDGLPTGGGNLVEIAAERFFERLGRRFGVRITLEKHIPVAAGLGGGSADAAAALRGLNSLAGNPFTPDILREIALKIGADVPFLVEGGTAICRGIGEEITPVAGLPEGAFVVAIKGEGVSTPVAFRELDVRFDHFAHYTEIANAEPLCKALEQGNMERAAALCHNNFEDAILPLRPAVGELIARMLEGGARTAHMSGSGPSVFGWFQGGAEAEQVAEALTAGGARAYPCTAVRAVKP